MIFVHLWERGIDSSKTTSPKPEHVLEVLQQLDPKVTGLGCLGRTSACCHSQKLFLMLSARKR